jgi:hypothetical protein
VIEHTGFQTELYCHNCKTIPESKVCRTCGELCKYTIGDKVVDVEMVGWWIFKERKETFNEFILHPDYKEQSC